jgi:hypothetical protein
MTRLWILAALGLLAGCGPRAAGAQANQTYFWRVISSELEFGTCSDQPTFRAGLTPLKFEANSYLIYLVDKAGKTATTQACDRLDASTCKPAATPIVFTIAGTELDFSTDQKQPLLSNDTPCGALTCDADHVCVNTACALRDPPVCHLLDTTTWLLTDKGATGTLDITHVLSLVDNPADCDASDQQIKAQSPNMLGLEGCVVTFKVGLSMK